MLAGRFNPAHWTGSTTYSAFTWPSEEALVNAIYHGNRLDAAKQVWVTCHVSPDRVRMEITDEGCGFNPGELPDPTCPELVHAAGGRGVMLMKAFMSRVEYNAPGNHVILEKDRGGKEDHQ